MSVSLQVMPRLQQTLSPRLQQSNQILQLTIPDFLHMIFQELEKNPFLEMEDPDSELAIEIQSREGDFSFTPSRTIAEEQEPDIFHTLAASPTLQEALIDQLFYLKLPKPIHTLAIFIINALDENGYLRCDFNELIDETMASSIAPSLWQKALDTVQSLSPAGVGARTLQECLLLQVPSLSGFSPQFTSTLKKLIECGLPDVAQNDLSSLCEKLNTDAQTIQSLCAALRQLDPKPGRRFADSAYAQTIPDVYVFKRNKTWKIVPNFQVIPKLKVHQPYVQQMKKQRFSSKGPLYQAWRDAKWMVKCIEKRHHTICRVAKAILSHQHLFFEYGEQALKPLLINDIATQLGVHESTISRATSNKYMSTPHGVYAFRYFFTQDIPMSNGGTCSTQMVKSRIKELIEAEPDLQPFSDVDLHKKLEQEDIVVAKRTVTKYRLELNIPNSQTRKRQYQLSLGHP